MATASFIEIVGDYKVDMNESLGEGSIGRVYQAKHKDKKGEFAAKKITVEKQHLEYYGEYEKQADLLTNQIPPHENIVKIYDCCKKEYGERGIAMVDIWIIAELCPLGNLAEFAQQTELSSEKKLDLIYQSTLAVQHLHRCGFAHCDIKPEHILITGKASNPTAKLTDFGELQPVLEEDGRPVAMSVYSGTPPYMAPEKHVLPGGHPAYDKSIDVYSLGLTAKVLLDSCKGSAVKPPMFQGKGMGQLMQENHDTYGSAEKAFEDLPLDKESDNELERAIKTIIKQMISFKPGDRPTIEEVVDSLAALRQTCQWSFMCVICRRR